MAFIKLRSGQGVFVSAEQGQVIWRVMNGERSGTRRQRAFVARIKHLYLNRANAPKSYLERYPDRESHLQQQELVLQYRLPYID